MSTDRNVALYFCGTIISKLGDKIYILAIPWLIYELTQSSVSMGAMFLVQTVPFIFISPIAGILADRYSRRKLLIVSAMLQALLIGMIPLLYHLSLLKIGHIFLLGFLIASVGACYSVVNSTIIPQLFDKEKLIKINSFFQFIDTSSVLFGSVLAGILITKIGVYQVLIVNALSFGAIILAILSLKFLKEMKPQAIKTNSFEQLREGAQYLWNHPILRPLTLLILLANIANGALVSMLVYFSRDKLSLTSEQIGWVYAGAAITQILAIILVNYMGKKEKTLNIMLGCLIVSSIGIVLVSFSWNWISLLIAIAVQSAPVIMFNVLNRTLRQKIVPSYIFGRVSGLIMMLSLGSLPLAGFITGLISDVIDIRYIFLTLGLGSLIIIYHFRFLLITNSEKEKLTFSN